MFVEGRDRAAVGNVLAGAVVGGDAKAAGESDRGAERPSEYGPGDEEGEVSGEGSKACAAGGTEDHGEAGQAVAAKRLT